MWWWRRVEKIWINFVRNEIVSHAVKEKRNILHAIKRREANWIGYTLSKNCLLNQINE
jgi:hypothetical protein